MDLSVFDESVKKELEKIQTPTKEIPLKEPPPPEPEKEAPGKEDKSTISEDQGMIDDELIDAGTSIVTSLIDGLQHVGLEMAAKHKMKVVANAIAPNGLIRLNELLRHKRESKNITDLYSETDAQLLELGEKVKDYVDSLPFSEDTINNIKAPLKTIIRKRIGKISPEALLALAVLGGIGVNAVGLRDIK